MTHPLLRKLAALAEEDGYADLTELLAAPGRTTLTSKLPARPQAATVNVHVSSVEGARALGNSLLGSARARFHDVAKSSGPDGAAMIGAATGEGEGALDGGADRARFTAKPPAGADHDRLKLAARGAPGQGPASKLRAAGPAKPGAVGADPAKGAFVVAEPAKRAFAAVEPMNGGFAAVEPKAAFSALDPKGAFSALDPKGALSALDPKPAVSAVDPARPAFAAVDPAMSAVPGGASADAAPAFHASFSVGPFQVQASGSDDTLQLQATQAPGQAPGQAVEDPFAMHLLPTRGDGASAAASLPGFEQASERFGATPEVAPEGAEIPGVDPVFMGVPALHQMFEPAGFEGGDAVTAHVEEEAEADVEQAPARGFGATPKKLGLGKAKVAHGDVARSSFKAAKPKLHVEASDGSAESKAPAWKAAPSGKAPDAPAWKAAPTGKASPAPAPGAAPRSPGQGAAPKSPGQGAAPTPAPNAPAPNAPAAPAPAPYAPAAPGSNAPAPGGSQKPGQAAAPAPAPAPAPNAPAPAPNAPAPAQGPAPGAPAKGGPQKPGAPAAPSGGPAASPAPAPGHAKPPAPAAPAPAAPAPAAPTPAPAAPAKDEGVFDSIFDAAEEIFNDAGDLILPDGAEEEKAELERVAAEQRAEVQRVHAQSTSTASAKAQTERESAFQEAQRAAKADKDQEHALREHAKLEEIELRETQEVTREGLAAEIEQASTREAKELDEAKASALRELDAKLTNQKERLATEHQALEAKVDAAAKVAEQEANTALGTGSDAVVKANEAETKDLDTKNEERKKKNLEQAGKDHDSFLEEGKTQEARARAQGETDAATAIAHANAEADAKDAAAKAAHATSLAAATSLPDDDQSKQGKLAACHTTLMQALNTSTATRTQGAASADAIRAEAKKIADGMAASAEKKAKEQLAEATKANSQLDQELVMAKAHLATKLMNDLAKVQTDNANARKAIADKATADKQAAKTDLTTKQAQIDSDRTAAVTEIETKDAADRAAATQKAEAAKQDLAQSADSELAAAAEHIRATTAEIDELSEEATKRNTEAIARVETHVAERVTTQITEMQKVCDDTLADLDKQAKDAVAAINKRAQDAVTSTHEVAAKVNQSLDTTQAKLQADLAKNAEKRKTELKTETTEALDKSRTKQTQAIDDVRDGKVAEKPAEIPSIKDEKGAKEALDKLRANKDFTPEQDKAAAKTASELRGAMETLTGTDEDKIHTLLAGKSPEEITAIKAHYAAQGFGDLDAALADEMSGDDLAEAQAKLSGDPVKAAVTTLTNAMEDLGTNPAKVTEALENIADPAQREQVRKAYEEKTGRKLDDDLSDELSGNDKALANALLIDDPVEREAKAAAVRLDEAMNGGMLNDITDGVAEAVTSNEAEARALKSTMEQVGELAGDLSGINVLADNPLLNDAKPIYTELEKIKDPAVRARVEQEYLAHTNRTLDSDVADDFGGDKDPRFQAYQAYADGDLDGARAARFRAGADSIWGTDEKEMFAQFEGRSPEERKRILDKVAAQEGRSVDQILTDEMSGLDREKADHLIKDGQVSPAFAIRYALKGPGTDNDGIKNALAGKSQAEIGQMRREYESAHGPGSFDADIRDENQGGRDAKLIELQLTKGEPQTDEERIQRIKDLHEIERGNGNPLIDTFRGSAGEDMDRQLKQAEELEKKLKDGTLDAADKQKLADVTAYHGGAIENYKAAQTEIVTAMNTVTDQLMAANPIMAAIQRIGNKWMVSESNYGLGEVAQDVAIEVGKMGVTVLTSMVGGSSMMSGFDAVGKQILMGAFKGLLNGVVAGALDEAAMRDLGDYMKGIITKGAGGAAQGAASALTEVVLDGAVGKLLEGLTPTSEGRARVLGALEALLKGAGGIALNPENYNKRIEDILRTEAPGILAEMFKGQQGKADAYDKSLAKKFGDEAVKNAPADATDDQVKAAREQAARDGLEADQRIAEEASKAADAAREKARAEGKPYWQRDAAAKAAAEQATREAQQRESQQRDGVSPPSQPSPAPTIAPTAPAPEPPPPSPPSPMDGIDSTPTPGNPDPIPESTPEREARADKAEADALAQGKSPAKAKQLHDAELLY